MDTILLLGIKWLFLEIVRSEFVSTLDSISIVIAGVSWIKSLKRRALRTAGGTFVSLMLGYLRLTTSIERANTCWRNDEKSQQACAGSFKYSRLAFNSNKPTYMSSI